MKNNKFLKSLLSSLMALSVISTSAVPVSAEDSETEPEEVAALEEGAQEETTMPEVDPAETEDAEEAEAEPEEAVTVAEEEAPEEAMTVSEEETPEEVAFIDFEKEIGNIYVTAKAEEGTFPVDVELAVKKLDADSYLNLVEEVAEFKPSKAVAVDISFVDEEGNEYEPAEGKQVSVTIKTEEIEATDAVSIIHILDEEKGEAEVLETSVEEDAIAFESDGFSVFIVADDGSSQDDTEIEKAVATYVFKFNDEVVDTQYVKKGDTLLQPETPNAGQNMRFLGWYLESDTTKEVVFGAVDHVTADEVVNVVPKFEKTYYVTYYDGKEDDGTQNILQVNTVHVVVVEGTEQPGKEDISKVSAQERKSDQKFHGWSYENTDEAEAISQSVIDVTGDVTLYPVFKKGAWLHFVSGPTGSGATYYAPVLYNYGKTTSSPGRPTRTGYTFVDWYTEEEGGSVFTFGGTLSKDTTIYAHWAPASTKYTIVYWKQKVSDAKNATEKTYDYAGVETGNATALSSYTLTSAQKNAHGETGFTLNNSKTEQTKEIAADGTTKFNVYYDRNLMTIYFRSNNGNTILDTYTGLYGQALNKYDYEWPGDDKWTSNTYGRGTTTTFIDTFIFTNMVGASADGTTFTCYQADQSGNRYIYHYKQNVDGSWPAADQYTTRVRASAGGYNATNKYAGFDLYAYRQNGNENNWDNDRYWNSISSGGSIPQSYNNLYIRYSRNLRNLQFIDSYSNEVYATNEVYYEASIKGYENSVADPTSTRPGYKFSGWYSDISCTTPFDFDTTMPDNDVAVYAGWEPIYYLIQIDPNGGELTSTESTFFWLTYDQKINEYTDVVRNYVKDGSGSFYYINEQHDDFYVAKKGLTRDQIWDIYKTLNRKAFYTATPIADDYVKVSDYEPGYSYEIGAYKIIGWYEVNGDTETPYSFGEGVKKDLKLRAEWRRVGNFAVTYYDPLTDDYAVGLVDNKTYSDKSNFLVLGKPAVNDEAHKGYRFVGWEYNGTVYYPNDIAELDATLATDKKTIGDVERKAIRLTAVWNKLPGNNPDNPGTTTVTFHGNADTAEVKATVAIAAPGEADKYTVTKIDAYNSSIRIPVNVGFDLTKVTTVRNGYVFAGWARKANASVDEILFTGTEKVAADEQEWLPNDLYAIWTKTFKIDHSSKDKGVDVDEYSFDGYEVTDGKKVKVADIVLKGEDGKPILDNNGVATFDLTKAVRDGYFYGGYYSVRPADKYEGGRNLWDQANAYTQYGTQFKPGAESVYYLKEVPVKYLQPYTQYVYNTSYDNVVCGLYMITAVDDNNYDKIGTLAYKGTDEADYAIYEPFKFTMKYTLKPVTGTNSTILNAKTVLGATSDVNSPIAVWNVTEMINEGVFDVFATPSDRPPVNGLKSGKKINLAPYVLTPDHIGVSMCYREFTTTSTSTVRPEFTYRSDLTNPANRVNETYDKTVWYQEVKNN